MPDDGGRHDRRGALTAGARRQAAVLAAAMLVAFLPPGPPASAQRAETWEPLVTTRGTRAFDVEYELWYYVNVIFESEVERTAGGYEYLVGEPVAGDTSVRVEWRALEESAFGDAVDDVAELRIGPLEAGTVSEWLVLTSSSPPRVSERSARMLGSAPSGNETVQFSGPAPAYVPR